MDDFKKVFEEVKSDNDALKTEIVKSYRSFMESCLALSQEICKRGAEGKHVTSTEEAFIREMAVHGLHIIKMVTKK